MPSFPELTQPLTDGVIELRPASEWDIPDILIAHQDDPDLHRRLGLARPPSGAELGRRSEHEPEEWAAGRGLRLTVVAPEDPTCRGQLAVHHVDWPVRSAELGLWLAPQARGQGWAARALRLAAGWLFGACGLDRLTLLTDATNQPMIRAAESAGFTETDRSPEAISLTLARPLPGPPTA